MPANTATIWSPQFQRLLFIRVLIAALGINYGGLGVEALAYAANEAAYVVYGWMALGVVILGYYLVRRPERITRTGEVFTHESDS